ncbi:GrpE protein HSP-70 cofactor [Paucilactobacillus vaccinostercus DSM 20634]|jgi:molecular chaperone GrpE|uniref:Protein GrpE n=1 Tax=Paucilactobacillus vaccinostercus DSM 20634 TaxID=1423813 RepID=A0A0R2AA05_9LACO|nr:nucleotide exchange factor GrpE [Paucilactobacillus vaccinostercus]KRM62468.1 GrpE protein HSP-70 cofactor [Paucilactobacillus vaccinostercus DSM 20634]RRG09643.1 MAG: nucleotide exchange factor GrpE [Lactobacillus sp.]
MTDKQADQEKQQAAEQAQSEDVKQTDDQATAADDQSADQVSDEQKKIDELKQKADDFEDKYLRAEAEIQNMNGRFKKEQAQILKYDGQSLAKDILPVMDNLKRALEIDVDDESGQQLKKGIQMVHDHLSEALTKNGVKEIESLNQKFDPSVHQAVQSVAVEGDQKPDTVVKVLQAGYQLQDRVLRPAMVVVAQ